MSSPVLKFERTHPDAKLPSYGSAKAAGFDLYACLDDTVKIAPGDRMLIPTGLRVDIPQGYVLKLYPRSGNALREGLTLANATGIIDEDYTGEIKAIAINLGEQTISIDPGVRIAQGLLEQAIRPTIIEDVVVKVTERGAGGFGSTGKK